MTEYGSTSAVCVLYTVFKDGPVTAREVAERLDADRGHMGTVLRRLHETGVVTREKRLNNEARRNPYEYAIRVPEETNG